MSTTLLVLVIAALVVCVVTVAFIVANNIKAAEYTTMLAIGITMSVLVVAARDDYPKPEYTYDYAVQASINGEDCAYEIWRAETKDGVVDEDTWDVVYQFDKCAYNEVVEVYTEVDIYFIEDTRVMSESGKIDTILPTEADVWIFIADQIIANK